MSDQGWVTAWLRPGDELAAGGVLPAGRFGVRLDSDVELTGTGEELGKLGDQLAIRFDSERVESVTRFAETMASIYPGEGSGFASFTCYEADSMAHMLGLFGHIYTAVNVIAGHCLDDDCGDAHGYIRHLDDDGDEAGRDEAAAVYVRRLLGDQDAQPAGYEAKVEALEVYQQVLAGGPDKKIAEEARDMVFRLRQELGESITEIEADGPRDGRHGDPVQVVDASA